MSILAGLAACLLAALPAAGREGFRLSDEMRRTTAGLRTAGLADELGYKLIESLTTEVGPRLAGSEAEGRARDWAVGMFEDLGFDKVWVEEFEMEGWMRGREEARVLGGSAQPLLITALGGSVATPGEGLEADVVRFGSLHELEAAPPGSLSGRIAFIDQKMFRTQDGSGYGDTVPIRSQGAIAAARKGAVAVLIRSVGTSHERFPHTGQMRWQEGVERIPAAALSNPDADQLARLLRLGPTSVHLLLTPRETGTVISGNVIAEFTGTDLADEIVLLGAHLDSWDLSPGAIDDASGAGIVTAAAHLVAGLPERPRRTIRVVLFGAEEVGLKGAYDYVRQNARILDRHVIAAESDFGDGRIWRFDTRVAESALPVMAAIQRELRPLGIGPGTNLAGGGPDLIPMRNQGVPVVTLLQDGTRYFDLHHTANDTFDKVDLERIRQNVAAYAVFTYLTANLDADFRPRQTNASAAP